MPVMKFVLGKTGLVVASWYENNLSFPHTQPGRTFCSQSKGLNIRNSLNSILLFDQLEILKTEASSVITNFVTLRLTKVKFLKIISFMPFLIQIGYVLCIHVVFPAILA